MAISKKGNGGYNGKVGNTVEYMLKGQLVKRQIGVCNKPPSDAQLANLSKTSMITKFLGPVNEFINIGFEQETKRTTKSAYNIATSYNWVNAITGDYPDQRIDFSKVLLSRGKMPQTNRVEVQATSEGLVFTWDPELSDHGKRWSDQVMMMAYMPDLEQATYMLNGAKRTVGTDFLKMSHITAPVVIETYISFVTANHKMVSTSIYTGQILWDGIDKFS